MHLPTHVAYSTWLVRPQFRCLTWETLLTLLYPSIACTSVPPPFCCPGSWVILLHMPFPGRAGSHSFSRSTCCFGGLQVICFSVTGWCWSLPCMQPAQGRTVLMLANHSQHKKSQYALNMDIYMLVFQHNPPPLPLIQHSGSTERSDFKANLMTLVSAPHPRSPSPQLPVCTS